jgi:purine nucleosidase
MLFIQLNSAARMSRSMPAPPSRSCAYQNATWFHGRDGLGDHNYPDPRSAAAKAHAVDAIIQTIEANPGVVLVTLGPLTNIALALAKKPQIAGKVSRCVVMGGAPCCEGNVTPAAEYNIWVDPEAARMVMNSGLPIELVGWHLCRGGGGPRRCRHRTFSDSTIRWRSLPSSATATLGSLKVQTGEDGICLPDPVAMSLALDPTIGTDWSEHYVDVETQSDLTRGMTVVDRLNVAADDRNQVVWAAVLAKKRQSQSLLDPRQSALEGCLVFGLR